MVIAIFTRGLGLGFVNDNNVLTHGGLFLCLFFIFFHGWYF